MSGSQIKRIANDMRMNGYNPSEPVEAAAFEGKKIMINAHRRAAAAIKTGLKEVPVREIEVRPSQGRQLLREADEARVRGY
jgi:filamentous hemagglutinin